VAADLDGVASHDRAGSLQKADRNGGILISNMLTRYPERFGALFCTISAD